MLDLYKNIKNYRLNKGLTQTELAKLTGYTDRSSIAKIENGDVDLPQSKILLFAEALDVTPGILMGNSGIALKKDSLDGLTNISTPAARAIPILGTICAGNGIFCEENYDGLFFVDNSIRADLCLNVKGDSMVDSNIFDGDKAFICQNCLFEEGKIYAVRINDDSEAVLKRVFRQDDNLILNSSNSEYAPIIERADNVSIIGECIGVYHSTN